MSQESWLRQLTNTELAALVAELEERAEQFSMSTRAAVNDELRRRKMPLVGAGRSRH
jgi:hypothetical protein